MISRISSLIGIPLLLVATGVALIAETHHARVSATTPRMTPEKIAQFIREHYGVQDSVKLNVEPLHSSTFSGFYESVLNTDDGKQPRSNPIYLTKDGRYLILGNLFPVGADSKSDIDRFVRETAKLPATTKLVVGPVVSSAFPEFLKASLTADDGKSKQSGQVFLTRDSKIGILGNVTPLDADPAHVISTRNQPSVGPANAKVTIVEYADLECPTCARFHQYLEKDFMPQYGNKVRVIFKEFPLPMHDWSRTAAIANECGYQISPSTFANYRTLIFANQNVINAINVRDQMLSLGEQAGLDRVKLAACLDSKASVPRIEADVREAEKLGVSSTPTSFINGRMVVGAPPAAEFTKMIDQALAQK